MLPYYILMGATVITSIIYFVSRNTNNPFALNKLNDQTANVFFAIWLILLCCRAESCGIDLWVYRQFFNDFSGYSVTLSSINELNSIYDTEKGYILYNLIIHLFTDNFRWFVVITSIICIVPLWYFYKKESDNQFISIMIFLMFGLFSMYFSGIRQSLAISMAIPAFYACKKKKIGWFIVFCLIATFFHQSAFVIFAIYPIYRIKLTKKHLPILIPTMIVFYIFNKQIFAFLGKFIKYNTGTDDTNAFGVLALLLIFTIYSFVIPDNDELLNMKYDYNDVCDFIGLRNILVLATFMQMFAPINFVAMRMNYYFLAIVPIAVSKVATKASNKNKMIAQIAVVVMAVFFFARYLYNASPGDTLHVYPYETFWSN